MTDRIPSERQLKAKRPGCPAKPAQVRHTRLSQKHPLQTLVLFDILYCIIVKSHLSFVFKIKNFSKDIRFLEMSFIWKLFKDSFMLCMDIILANAGYVKSIKIRIPGFCDWPFNSIVEAAVFWEELFRPLEKLRFGRKIRFITICWKGPFSKEPELVAMGQCAHAHCQYIVRELSRWREEAKQLLIVEEEDVDETSLEQTRIPNWGGQGGT